MSAAESGRGGAEPSAARHRSTRSARRPALARLLAVIVTALGGSVLLLGMAGSQPALGAQAIAVEVYPSATTVEASGPLPAGGGRAISLAAAIGGHDEATIVVSGAQQVSLITPASVGPLPVQLFFAHYVHVGPTLVPDALLPWDGQARNTEQPNQPLWFQVTVPRGTTPGVYADSLSVSADGVVRSVPVSVHVFNVTLPAPGQARGNLLTSFHVSAQTYVNEVGKLYGLKQSVQFEAVYPTLYPFLASYGISPASWGYGAPLTRIGYTQDERWWRDSASIMPAEAGTDMFAAMAIPLSNNRTSPADYIAGLSPYQPLTWCGYLKSVHSFWQVHGWLNSVAYLYGLDEPGASGMQTIGQQATVLHACFPGGKELVTGNPTPANSYLWQRPGPGDVDIWAVLATSYYGKYTVPLQSRKGISRARSWESLIDQVRARSMSVWTYNYAGTHTPSFTADEPLSDSRMLFLWSALEGVSGVLDGQGTTNYKGTNPYVSLPGEGQGVLVYPGKEGPVPSARLEEIRNGIEDWEVYNIVRQRHGAADVRRILGSNGLFSATSAGVELGCTVGCQLKTATPFSWPEYSHDATTPARIAEADLQALAAASS